MKVLVSSFSMHLLMTSAYLDDAVRLMKSLILMRQKL